MRWKLLTCVFVVASLAVPGLARAGCCNLRKLDAEIPTVTLRACEANAARECSVVFFEGPLSVGDAANVCTAQSSILYQEALSGEAFGPVVVAICDGDDIEI